MAAMMTQAPSTERAVKQPASAHHPFLYIRSSNQGLRLEWVAIYSYYMPEAAECLRRYIGGRMYIAVVLIPVG